MSDPSEVMLTVGDLVVVKAVCLLINLLPPMKMRAEEQKLPADFQGHTPPLRSTPPAPHIMLLFSACSGGERGLTARKLMSGPMTSSICGLDVYVLWRCVSVCVCVWWVCMLDVYVLWRCMSVCVCVLCICFWAYMLLYGSTCVCSAVLCV